MKVVETGDSRVVSIIKTKIIPDNLYRLSGFTYCYSEGKHYLIQNTLTGMVVSLSESEWDIVKSAREKAVGGGELIAAGIEELVQNRFFAEDGLDEYKQYDQVVSVLKLMSHEGKGTKTYTILPTTGCNARCSYCYEEGLPVYSMNEETADRVIGFINETRWQKPVKLVWFGGEPLVQSRIITHICRGLKEKSIPFRSKIITNATLLTPSLLEEAVSLWHLETAQVSVDGSKEDYEARKRFADPAFDHYGKMMTAVGHMLERGIKVSLRCNYDDENLDGLESFFSDVNRRFGDSKNLSVYLAMLFQARFDEQCIDLYKKAQILNTHLRDLGLKNEDNADTGFRLRLNLCGADSGDKSVVIAPDGKLYHCEHLPGSKPFGSVYDSQIAVCSDERAAFSADGKCRTCCFLPECTPFFKNGCPDYFSCCREFKQIEIEGSLRRLINKNSRLR